MTEENRKEKIIGGIAALIAGLLTLLLLLLSFTFERQTPPQTVIEIAMDFGSTETGMGDAEPMPAPTVEPSAAAAQPQAPAAATAPSRPAVTQTTTETRPVASPTPRPRPERPTTTAPSQSTSQSSTPSTQTSQSQPATDTRGSSALDAILGGRGNSQSSGQGSSNQPGNVGDPSGGDGGGSSIGENWRTRIPEPQTHNCDSSGVIIVDIVVNSGGGIRTARAGARGSTSNDPCLYRRAEELVKRYVTAQAGADGRRGSYRVNLR
ncbi:MAG: hypothetical protein Q4F57_00415 [Weeksellaceae bacterium]|nr:hypothetical protein [Weeksellaceae bacterium]